MHIIQCINLLYTWLRETITRYVNANFKNTVHLNKLDRRRRLLWCPIRLFRCFEQQPVDTGRFAQHRWLVVELLTTLELRQVWPGYPQRPQPPDAAAGEDKFVRIGIGAIAIALCGLAACRVMCR